MAARRDRTRRAFVLDVGNASCNIIALGKSRAIIIDCARSSYLPLRVLRRLGIKTIEVLVVTHNDIDHVGGAAGIVERYPGTINKVYYLCDRPLEDIMLFRLCKNEIAQGRMEDEDVIRLELSQKQEPLFEDEGTNIRLELLAPTFMDNQEAVKTGDPNQTSGVLVFAHGESRVVFSGDSKIAQWAGIRRRYGKVRCGVFVVPHHGGDIGDEPDGLCFYEHFVDAGYAIVSCGTRNQYGHPHPDVIASLAEHSEHVLCTEITDWCFGRFRVSNDTTTALKRREVPGEVIDSLEAIRGREFAGRKPFDRAVCSLIGRQKYRWYGHLIRQATIVGDSLKGLEGGLVRPLEEERRRADPTTMRHDDGKPADERGIACAGTILLGIGDEKVEVPVVSRHRDAARRLREASDWHPLCQRCIR